jgi:hypothetical protein
MMRRSTLILGSLTAVLLAACGGPRSDTGSPGGAGAETGAAPDAGTPTDTGTAYTPADTSGTGAATTPADTTQPDTTH